MSNLDDRASAIEHITLAMTGFAPEAQTLALQAIQELAEPLKAAASVQRAANSVKNSDPTVQLAAMKATAGRGVPAPDPATANNLWSWMVIGLLLLLGIALVGLLVMIGLNRPPDVIVTVFTALLTGTIGLFVPSPAGSTSGKAR